MPNAERGPLITSFDRWVSRNNIPDTYEYRKGWWDYVELIQRFARKFDCIDVTVVGHYIVGTPPPEEKLPMPAVVLLRDGVSVAMKWDFGAPARWPREWTMPTWLLGKVPGVSRSLAQWGLKRDHVCSGGAVFQER